MKINACILHKNEWVTHSPVAGRGASLGLAAEHHLLVPLQGLHRIHDAARLLGENRTLQDAAPWVTTGHTHNCTAHSDTFLFVKRCVSQRQKKADGA